MSIPKGTSLPNPYSARGNPFASILPPRVPLSNLPDTSNSRRDATIKSRNISLSTLRLTFLIRRKQPKEKRRLEAWHMISGSEVARCSSRPAQMMPWNNEIERAEQLHNLETSSSITGTAIGNVETWDSKIASKLMNIFNEDFRNKAFKEEATAQQQSRFLTKRQIAWMIFDHFKISDTDGTVLGPLRPRESRAQKRQSAVLEIHSGTKGSSRWASIPMRRP